MLPYLIVFSLTLIFYKCALKFKHKGLSLACLSICVLIPSLLTGFHDDSLGWDWKGYGIPIWQTAIYIDSFSHFLSIETSIESGYKFINYIIAQLSDDYHVFFFFHQLIQISIAIAIAYINRGYKHSEYILLFYFLYLFNPSINILRQSVAMMISFLAYATWDKQQKKISYALSTISCLFHFSAIIAFLIYILLKFKFFFIKYKKPLLLTFLLMLIFNSSQIIAGTSYSNILTRLIDLNIVSGHYTGYIDQSGTVAIHKTDVVFLIAIITFVLWGPIKERNKETCMEIVIFATTAFFFNLFGNVTDVAFRVAYYFVLPISILIPRVSSNNAENQKACIVFSLLLTIRFFYFAYTNGAENTIPYSSTILGI